MWPKCIPTAVCSVIPFALFLHLTWNYISNHMISVCLSLQSAEPTFTSEEKFEQQIEDLTLKMETQERRVIP